MAGFGDQLKKGIVRIIQSDIISYQPNTTSQDAWFILFLEVFDNLPNDRVYGDRNEQKMETWVSRDRGGKLIEELRPI